MFCVQDNYILFLIIGLLGLIIYLCTRDTIDLRDSKKNTYEICEEYKEKYKQLLSLKENASPSTPVFTGIPPEPSLISYAKPIQNINDYNPVHEIYPVSFTPGGEFGKRGVIALRNVDKPYQDLTTMYQRVGTCHSESQQDDTILTLYRRDIMPERDFYEYKVIDHTNGNNLEIFLSTNITLLRNGDRIMIPGYESKGQFVVHLDRQYNYIRLNPF
jgi:hypothetical protein